MPQIVAIWEMVPIFLLWCIWRERNDRNFEDKECSLEELKCFFDSLMSWEIDVDFNGRSFHDFLVSSS